MRGPASVVRIDAYTAGTLEGVTGPVAQPPAEQVYTAWPQITEGAGTLTIAGFNDPFDIDESGGFTPVIASVQPSTGVVRIVDHYGQMKYENTSGEWFRYNAALSRFDPTTPPPNIAPAPAPGTGTSVNSVELIISDMTGNNEIDFKGIADGDGNPFAWMNTTDPAQIAMGTLKGSSAPRWWQNGNGDPASIKDDDYWTRLVAWMVAFEDESNTATNAGIETRNHKIRYLSKATGQWTDLRSTVGSVWYGFGRNPYGSTVTGTLDVRDTASGTKVVKYPSGAAFTPHGEWNITDGSNRIDIASIVADIGGLLHTYEGRLVVYDAAQPDDLDDAIMGLQSGIDAYPYDGYQFGGANPGVGLSRTKKLTRDWQPFNFATLLLSTPRMDTIDVSDLVLSAAHLRANSPLSSTTTPTEPPVTAPTPAPIRVSGASGKPTINAFSDVYIRPGQSTTFDFTVEGTPRANGGGFTTWIDEAWGVTAYDGSPGVYTFTLNASGLAEQTYTATLHAVNDSGDTTLQFNVIVSSDVSQGSTPTPGPTPAPTPGGATPADSIVAPSTAPTPAAPAGGSYTEVTPPEVVTKWYLNTLTNPQYWRENATGLHDSSGDTNDPPTGRRADWPVPFPYKATRSHDRSDSKLVAALQWARLNPTEDVYDFDRLKEWIDDNTGKFLVFTLFGTPVFAQRYPGESWGYGYMSGGASSALPGKITKFLNAMFAWLNTEYGSNKIDVLEFWNEPNVRWQDSDADNDRQSPAKGAQKFWRGTGNEYADNAIEAGEACPSDVGYALGAWEGQSGDNDAHVLAKALTRMDALGKLGLITVWSFHIYTYKGAAEWWKTPDEALAYITRMDSFGLGAPTLKINSEQGAEYSDGTGADGSSRLSDWTSAQRGEWIRRVVVSQLALGVDQVYLYTYRAADNELPPDDTNVIAAFQWLDDNAGSWLYRVGRTVSNKLYLGFIDPDGVQRDVVI